MSEAEVEDEALPFCWVDMAVGPWFCKIIISAGKLSESN